MSDETENTATLPAEQPEQPAQEKSPLAKPLPVYVVAERTQLQHDGQVYRAGATFTCPDEAVIAELRRTGAIVLPEELMAAETLAAQASAKDAEIEALRAEIEALRRAAETTTKRGK